MTERSQQVTELLDMMDEETMHRFNRGLVLYDESDETLEVLKTFFTKCKTFRNL